MSILRTLVMVANVGVVVWLAWLFVVDFPDSDSLILAGLILLFVLNLYFILSSNKGSDWFGLFLERKALEEQRKIKDLER